MTSLPTDLPVELVPLDTLTHHPDNPRQGDVGAIATAIEHNGWHGTIVVQRSTRRILAGNHRVKALRARGDHTVPVWWVDVDDATARRIVLADNRSNDLATYDDTRLLELLDQAARDDDLLGTGFDGDDVDELRRLTNPPPPTHAAPDDDRPAGGRRMRIILAGTRSFGAATLRLLHDRGDTIVLVAAPPGDRLATLATLHHHPVTPRLTRRDAEGLDADLIVAAHSHDFISRPTRHATRLGAIGYHPSLLPTHRGRDAVRWTIRDRDRITGGTVYWLDDRVDAGPIANQRHVHVHPAWDATDLWRDALFPLGQALLAATLHDLDHDRIVRIPQDEACATWEPAIDAPPLARPDLPELPAPDAPRQRWVVA